MDSRLHCIGGGLDISWGGPTGGPVKDRRKHVRYKLPDVMAMVRIPESALDFYFHVANMSREGLALVAESVDGFPIREDSVVDLEVYSHLGPIECRGVVARVITGTDIGEDPRGYGVRIYGLGGIFNERWTKLVDELAEPT
jgi:hypothetical protein